MQQFFYSEQIRRYLLQFTRMLSNFQVEYGTDTDGAQALIRVPIRYGDASRQAQTIIQQNSANMMPSTPLMTFYINALEYDRPRLQEPYFVDKIQVRQRTYDESTDSYETTQGNAFTIERLMPVPYKLGLNLDIWTSNTNQKLQLLEQILTLFNPALEIQNTDNYIDWTSLSVVNLDSVTWSSRNIPQGTEDPIDIATLKFNIPIWISSPAKVKKLGVIERIITSIYDGNGDASNAVLDNDLLLGTRQKVTPYGYGVVLLNGQLQVVKQSTVLSEPITSEDPFDSPIDQQILWHSVVGAYGVLRDGISYITLDNPWDPDSSIVGTIAYNPADDRFMLFSIDTDTIPGNTLLPVDAIINPLLSGPNRGDSAIPNGGLPAPVYGQRYLLTESTGNIDNTSNPTGWEGNIGQALIAEANDIIEYDGAKWRVVFNSREITDLQYVTNITTSIQYRWDGAHWYKSYDGLYRAGQWNIVL